MKDPLVRETEPVGLEEDLTEEEADDEQELQEEDCAVFIQGQRTHRRRRGDIGSPRSATDNTIGGKTMVSSNSRTLVPSFPAFQGCGVGLEPLLEQEQVAERCGIAGGVEGACREMEGRARRHRLWVGDKHEFGHLAPLLS